MAGPPSAPTTTAPSVLIIGAGFGGIATAIELQRSGITDITILEAAEGLGGTWFHNTYPGAACDVASYLYSYSYARRADWSRVCAPQSEILDYLRETAARFGIDRLIHTSTPVDTCAWSETDSTWTATAADGRRFTADTLVIATGQLHQPHYPEIPGLDRFAGPTFHSARWDHSVDLTGKRVAVIGNGASAVQFVPEVAKVAGQLTLFHRTGNYFLPRTNPAYGRFKRELYRRVPAIHAVRRWAMVEFLNELHRTVIRPRTHGRVLKLLSTAFMRFQLRGAPELRKQVWPDYAFGCKRILITSRFLPALRRKNVDVVTDRITEITPEGVRTADGTLHEADVLVHSTGFRTTEFMLPMQVVGADGTRLEETWANGAHAHFGMTVPGFPSMFLVYGPNTNTLGGSIIVFLEAQATYIRSAITLLRARGAASIEVRREVEEASDRELQARFAGTAWLTCNSWYRSDTGRIVANWPGFMREFEERASAIEPSEFVLHAAERTTA